MTDNVIPLRLVEVGEGVAIDCDKVLKAALGNYGEVVVIGMNKNGEIDVRSSHGIRDACWLVDVSKTMLMEISLDGA